MSLARGKTRSPEEQATSSEWSLRVVQTLRLYHLSHAELLLVNLVAAVLAATATTLRIVNLEAFAGE